MKQYKEDFRTSNGERDNFISRFDSDGDLLKCITWGGMGYDNVSSLKIDNDGNTYVAGNFEYWVDFDPGPGEFIGNSLGERDMFASKFNPDLEFESAIVFGNSQIDSLLSMDVDDNGNIMLSGYFYNSVDFDPSQGEYFLSSIGSHDAFIAKYNSTFNLLWARSWGGESGDEAVFTLKDPEQNIVVLGNFCGQADFDPGPGEDILISHGGCDYSLMKLKPNGFWY
jgi:putative component of membrane protein insertase Oxa1/YidC/SpoIIIJ protein YidD